MTCGVRWPAPRFLEMLGSATKACLIAWLATLSIGARASSSEDVALAHAQDLLDEAVEEVLAVGPAVAARRFTAGGKWRVGSTYVVMNDFTGKLLAHAVNPKMVGKVMLEARDAAGKQFVLEGITQVVNTGKARVHVRWANPQTKRFDNAQILSKRVPGQRVSVSVVFFPEAVQPAE